MTPVVASIQVHRSAFMNFFGTPVALLASGAAADKLWQQGYKYLFGVFITAKQYTAGFVELLAVNNINTIALISADDLFSRSSADRCLQLG